MITKEQIFNASNSGLDIITHFYPDAQRGKNFKIREDERTASASLYKGKDGIWRVTDFGDDSKGRSGIDICMREKDLTFYQAILYLADIFGVQDESIKPANRADIEFHAAKNDEKEGEFNFEEKDFTDYELQVLGPNVTSDICKRYKYCSLAWYSRSFRKKDTGEIFVKTVKSTDTYPIFMRNCGTFQKVYEPLAYDKQHRFFCAGGENRPKDYINGMDELRAAYEKFNSKNETEEMLSEAVICSGERDALTCAALGYLPLWLNSETARLEPYQYVEIKRYVQELYVVPDLDSTGIRKAVEICRKYLQIKMVKLPEWIKNYKDARGKPRKDLRDWAELIVKTNKKNTETPVESSYPPFKTLISQAMPFQFWEFDKEKGQTQINTEYLLHFLFHSGFGTYQDEAGSRIIHILGSTVKEVSGIDIKKYLRYFLKEQNVNIKIINTVNNSMRVTNNTFDLLDTANPNFNTFSIDNQYFFFKNSMVEVNAGGVHRRPLYSLTDRHVWEKNIVPHNFTRLKQAFEITGDGDNGWNIDVKNKESHFFRYLINTSRIYWQTEYENPALSADEMLAYRDKFRFAIDGDLLSMEQQAEQELHLINKIFAIGYLLHRYKFMHRAWCVYLMDGRISTSDEDANGRSGKSFFVHALSRLLRTETIAGNDLNIESNKHLYDRVTEQTELVFIDEAGKYIDIGSFFAVITGDWLVNPKNSKTYAISFSKSPKLVISTNYAPRRSDPSTEGRLLYCLFSDYYHVKNDSNTYKRDWSIADDFGGKQLMMSDYPEEDWNADFNFLVDCLQFYLSILHSNVKIQPPMGSIRNRTYIEQMGANFREWAEVYFSEQGDNLNKEISRQVAMDDFLQTSKQKWTPQKFGKALKAFCANNGYTINPPSLCNDGNRIISRFNGKSTEMIYIQTNYEVNNEHTDEQSMPF